MRGQDSCMAGPLSGEAGVRPSLLVIGGTSSLLSVPLLVPIYHRAASGSYRDFAELIPPAGGSQSPFQWLPFLSSPETSLDTQVGSREEGKAPPQLWDRCGQWRAPL